jgi:hypothetical protein
MRQWIGLVVMLMAATAAEPARAGGRDPVCREPSEVDEMTREIRGQFHYAEVDPRLVTEQPTNEPRLVRCQVCVQLAPYDSMRFGDRPIRQCQPHGFEIRILSQGFVVRDLQ